jgi:hypothetical protein
MKDLPVISVKEARKLLGKEAKGMDDNQIMEVILLYTEAAKAYLENNMSNKQGKD